MVKINKAEMMYLKSKGVVNGENGISSYRQKWYLTETSRNIRLLNEYREKVTTFSTDDLPIIENKQNNRYRKNKSNYRNNNKSNNNNRNSYHAAAIID